MKTSFKLLNRIIVLFMIELMVMFPVIYALNTTTPSNYSGDTVPPFIDVQIPQYVSSNEMDIVGKTEPNAVVSIYVNDELRRTYQFPDGNIGFYGIDIKSNEFNSIAITATDASGISARKFLNVTSDMTTPVISIGAVPAITKERKIDMNGTVSELSTINISLNNKSISSQENIAFNVQLNLQEGKNYIEISAYDKAGHSAAESRVITSDTKKPTIEIIAPKPGSFYYQGRAVDTIKGITEPYARIKLYAPKFEITSINFSEYLPEKETNADSEGRFEFEDIDFEHVGELSLLPAPYVEYEGQEIKKGEKSSVNIILTAEDAVGFTSEKQVSYNIINCWTKNFAFDVVPLLNYQTPTLLSPQRIQDGTEIISFVLNLTYFGKDENVTVSSVSIERSCKAKEVQEDTKYKYACELLSGSSRGVSNARKTMWYFRYSLNPSTRFSNASKSFWKEFKEHELIFPLKITIAYTERDYDPADGRMKPIVKYQTKCFSLGYFVDIPLNINQIVPDSLLDSGIKASNATITVLNQIIPKLEQVIKVVGIGCLASFATRILIRFYRKFQCRMESYTGGLLVKKGEKSPDAACPKEEDQKRLPTIPGGPTKASVEGETYKDTPSGSLQERCPTCYGAWQAEANLYKAYRWLCDRIFCHKAPAKWTEKAPAGQIFKAEVESRQCAANDIAGVTPLLKVQNCGQEYKGSLVDAAKNYEICWKYGNKLYYYDGISEEKGTGDEETVYTLKRADSKNLGELTADEQLKVIKQEGSDNFATRINVKCPDLCKRYGKETAGTCEPVETCTASLTDFEGNPVAGDNKGGFLAGYTRDCWVDSVNGIPNNALAEPKKQCCCYLPKSKTEEKIGEASTVKWDYRQQQLYREENGKFGIKYPEKRYIAERDQSACFGMDNLFDYARVDKKIPVLDPFTQHIPAFQCLCLTGIRARLVMLRSILMGLMNCFYQIKKTGKANAGVCKELFAQYVCDLMYQVFVWFKNGCIPLPFGKGIKIGGMEYEGSLPSIGEGVKIGLNSLWDSVMTAGRDLESEYGESTLSEYLGGSEKAISRKICLAAFGFDIGFDIDTMLDMTYKVPFATTAQAFLPRRDFLTYNPKSRMSSFEYRTAWVIFPGCEISDYSIDLVCVNMEEARENKGIDCTAVENKEAGGTNGCDCLYSKDAAYTRSHRFYTGGKVTQGSYLDQDHHLIVDNVYRFDHMKITIHLAPGQDPQKCFPEEHRDGAKSGVFYFPIIDKTAKDIIDCYIDQRGYFVCNQGLGWNEKGTASFEKFTPEECQNKDEECYILCKDHKLSSSSTLGQFRDCATIRYEKGNSVEFKIKYTVQKNQCLYATLTNNNGEVVTDSDKTIYPLGEARGNALDQEIYGAILPAKYLGSFSAKYFEENKGSASIDRGNCTIVMANSFSKADESGKREGIILINFEKNTADGTYKLTVPSELNVYNEFENPALLSDFSSYFSESAVKKMVFVGNGFSFKFNNLPAANGECAVKTTSTGTPSKTQQWKMHLELRYPSRFGECDSQAFEKIEDVGVGALTELNQNLEVFDKITDLCSEMATNKLTEDEKSKLDYGNNTVPSDEQQKQDFLKKFQCMLEKEATPNTEIKIKENQNIRSMDRLCAGNKICAVQKGTQAAVKTPAQLETEKLLEKEITYQKADEMFFIYHIDELNNLLGVKDAIRTDNHEKITDKITTINIKLPTKSEKVKYFIGEAVKNEKINLVYTINKKGILSLREKNNKCEESSNRKCVSGNEEKDCKENFGSKSSFVISEILYYNNECGPDMVCCIKP